MRIDVYRDKNKTNQASKEIGEEFGLPDRGQEQDQTQDLVVVRGSNRGGEGSVGQTVGVLGVVCGPSPSCSTALEQQYAVKGFKVFEVKGFEVRQASPQTRILTLTLEEHSSTVEPCSSTLLLELHSGAMFLHTPLRVPQWSPVPPHSS
ncbi:unnamed protein product [Boreogadus saida]